MSRGIAQAGMLAALAYAIGGCMPDVDRFSVGAADAGHIDGSSFDAASFDAASDAPMEVGPSPRDGGTDASSADDAATREDGGKDRWEDAPMRGGCPMPQLLVGIRVDNDGLGRRGKIARFGLYPELERCSDLEAEGRIPFRPDALGWKPPTGVAVGGERGVLLVDIDDDTVVWEHEIDPFSAESTVPRDLFPIQMPGGNTRIAGTFEYAGRSELAYLRIFDEKGAQIREWDVRSESWPTDGDTYGMATRPRREGRLLSLTDSSIAADVNPFTGAVRDEPFAPSPPDAEMGRVRSYDDGWFVRTTWVARQGDEGAVYFLDNDGHASPDPPFGPVRCRGRGEDTHPCEDPEALLDVVADPTARGRFFAVCQGKGGYSSRHVVRFDNGSGPCEVVLNDGELEGIERAVTRLAIAVPE